MEKNGQPIGNQPQVDGAAAELGRLVFELADALVLRVDVRLHNAQLAGNAAQSL